MPTGMPRARVERLPFRAILEYLRVAVEVWAPNMGLFRGILGTLKGTYRVYSRQYWSRGFGVSWFYGESGFGVSGFYGRRSLGFQRCGSLGLQGCGSLGFQDFRE